MTGRVREVWKFAVPIGPQPTPATVEMPEGAEILRVGEQNDVVYVWALVDPNETRRDARQLLAAPTGYAIQAPLDYLGTTEIYDRRIVVHVFEVPLDA